MAPLYPLLGLLFQSDRHGYELKQIVDREFAPFWQIDFAQLYRSLAKMARADWVKAHAAAGAGGPDRKVYTLTPRGRRAFEAWLVQDTDDRNEFLVKARLAADCGLAIPELLDAQRRRLAEEHAARDAAHARARAEAHPGRLLLAHAALRESEASLAAFDGFAASVSPVRTTTRPRDTAPVIVGSDDPLLTRLAQTAHLSMRSVGSIEGLVALAQHQGNIAGVHLLDVETGEYNVSFIKHLVPEDEVLLVHLATRENGLVVAPGNPKKIRGVRDLTRRGIRFINRQRGAGTRLWLYSKLRAAHIAPDSIRDWERVAFTHAAVADAIEHGTADVGPGLCAVAAARGLDFIPIIEEQFDLAVPREVFDSRRLQTFLEALHSKEFQRAASALAGYDLTKMGRVIARVK